MAVTFAVQPSRLAFMISSAPQDFLLFQGSQTRCVRHFGSAYWTFAAEDQSFWQNRLHKQSEFGIVLANLADEEPDI